MSECVVRMEMPHDGLCDLALPFLGGTFCAIGGYRCNYCDDGVIPKWCPILCQLPEGHGRLVDADSMEKEVCGGCVHGEHKYANCIDCALANAPTIVPAEAERSE